MPQRPVSIVLPNHNCMQTLRACIESIFDTAAKSPAWELIVVDDGSSDGSLEYLESLKPIRLIRQPHLGIGHALNVGFEAAGKNDVVRIHADVVLETPGWLGIMQEAAQTLPKAGVIGAKLVYPDDRIYSAGRSILTGVGLRERFTNLRAFEFDLPNPTVSQEVDAVCGALAYYKRSAINKTGGVDEAYFPVWMDDDDFCLMARFHGFKVYIQPGVKAVHYTRAWTPTDSLYFNGSDGPIGTLRSLKPQVLNRHYPYWEQKWGWNPLFPDVNEIRRLYGKTEICWKLGEPMRYCPTGWPPTVDACIVTWNNEKVLRRCLESLAQTDYPQDRLKVYIADNACTDGTADYLEQLGSSYPFELHVYRLPVNAGAITGWNAIIVQGEGELVARLDDDIILPPGWLKTLAEDFRKRPYAGVVGCKITNNDNKQAIQCGSYRFYPRRYNHYEEPDEGQAGYLARTTHVQGCANLYRRDVLKRCGLFDLRYNPSQWDDPDHHLTLQAAGYEIIYDGRVEVLHKVTDVVAGSYAAISNQTANFQKLEGKWGNEIFETFDRALDMSHEGRFIPDDGDTTALTSLGPDPKDFPRQKPFLLPEAVKEELLRKVELRGQGPGALNINDLVDDHLAQAASLRRDGFSRMTLSVLHTGLNLLPYRADLLKALSDTYRELAEMGRAELYLRRACRLAPHDASLRVALEELRLEMSRPQTAARAAVVSERYAEVGEASTVKPVAQVKQRGLSKIRALMVNAYENRVAGGDMHQINKTRHYLAQLGVETELDNTPRPDVGGYDVVHLWNMWFPHQTLGQVRAVRVANPRLPVVHSTIYWDMSEKTWAEQAVPQLFSQSANSQQLDARLAQLASNEMMLDNSRRTDHREAYPGYETYQRLIMSMVDHLLPLSYAEVRNLKQTLGISKPYHVVRNAAEPEVFDRASADWFIEHYGVANFVLMVGLVEARKNQLMLLYALRDSGIPVVIVGRNYDRNYMRLCQKFAAPDTLFIEHLPHEHLASAMKAARVHALPSWMECASLANIEAALAGCNLVVSNRTSEPEYYQDNAYYCDPADIHSIRQSVLDAYNRYEEDAPKRRFLRDLFLNEYTWENAAKTTLAAYEQVLSKSAALPGTPKGAKGLAAEVKTAPVSIVIRVTRADLVTGLLADLKELSPTAQVIIVDDGAGIVTSTDPSGRSGLPAYLAEGCLFVHHQVCLGAAKAFNSGAVLADAPYILFLEDRARPTMGAIQMLLQVIRNSPETAGIVPMVLHPDERVRQAGIRSFSPIQMLNGLPYADPQITHTAEIPAALGEVLLVNRAEIMAENWLDEAFSDHTSFIDLCFKFRRRGKKIIYTPQAVVNWLGGGSPELSTSVLETLNKRYLGSSFLHSRACMPAVPLVVGCEPVRIPPASDLPAKQPVMEIAAVKTPTGKGNAAAILQNLLDAEDVLAAIKKYESQFDPELLELVRQNALAARREGDLDLAEGLGDLAEFINRSLNAHRDPKNHSVSDAVVLLDQLLAADDLPAALKAKESLLDGELLKLVRENVAEALQSGEDDLAEGLENLAEYIERVIQKRSTLVANSPNAAALLELLLNADDLPSALKAHEKDFNQDLLDLVLANVAAALRDGDNELAEGLDNLADYIRRKIFI